MFKKLLLGLIVLSAIGCKEKKDHTLLIGTASNMQFVMSPLVDAFEQETGIQCEWILASSGKITAQVKSGAPFDIFLTADLKYAEELYQEKFASQPPEIFALGHIVLWTQFEELDISLDSIQSSRIKKIAIANPKTAPYGRAAWEVLTYYSLLERVEDRLVYGESVSQTNQFIATQAVQIGFTSKSVVLGQKKFKKGKWIQIDPSTYSPLEHAVLVLNSDKHTSEKAQKFSEFLTSNVAREILNKFGYSISE